MGERLFGALVQRRPDDQAGERDLRLEILDGVVEAVRELARHQGKTSRTHSLTSTSLTLE